MTRSPSDLFDYLQSLIIGQGREAGQRLQLYPWQRRFLRAAFGQPDDAALSLARGGGKTTFTSAIACAALAGPLVEPMAEVANVAELQAARRQTVESAADLQEVIEGELETLREQIAKEWRIGGDPIDHSAELANLAAALESAARARLMALGGTESE